MNLTDLLHDAVDGIEPADRIDEIRARTAAPARSAARPWFIAAGATVLATAATVAIVAAVDSTPPPRHDHGPMVIPVTSETPGMQAVPVYFIGDTPSGPRLFREFDPMAGFDTVQLALDRLQRTPGDPDYRTPWPAGSFGQVTVKDGRIDVELNDPDAVVQGLAAQQVVYTLQAAAGQQLPVYFWRDGQRGNAPVTAAPMSETLSQVSISDPAEGNDYAGSFTARGRASEGLVTWELHLPDGPRGGPVVAHGSTTSDGTGDQLYPWQADVDLSGIQPGNYTFIATSGSFTDTRRIIVR